MANNSSLPKIIPRLKIHFETSGKLEKLPLGPIIEPKPGPTFEIEVAAPEIAVTKSNLASRTPLKGKLRKYEYSTVVCVPSEAVPL